MGLIIVMIVGAVLGWLGAIVVDQDDRVGTLSCALIGASGAITAALIAGGVPLFTGVTATQLLWAVAGAVGAIIAANVIHTQWTRGGSLGNSTSRMASGKPAPIHR